MELIAISYSPWSEKARWALDHHRLPYREIEYIPMLGAPWLRWKTGLAGRKAVPILLHNGEATLDSYEIARLVDGIGGCETLFPEKHLEAIRKLNSISENLLGAARTLLIRRLLNDTDALLEAVPPPLRIAKPLAVPLAKIGTWYIQRKHSTDVVSDDQAVKQIAASLQRLRASLSGKDTFFERFSFADIIGAACINAIKPVSTEFITLGDATRRCWTRDDIAGEFADLVTWRDKVYQNHRDPAA
jgi:glutathione S-transferase